MNRTNHDDIKLYLLSLKYLFLRPMQNTHGWKLNLKKFLFNIIENIISQYSKFCSFYLIDHMKSSKKLMNHKQKRIGFKRPVYFNIDENSKDKDENENIDTKIKMEKLELKKDEEQVDISKMKIPSTFESDQKLNFSNSIFDDFNWIQTEPEFLDFDQDIQIPDKFIMPF